MKQSQIQTFTMPTILMDFLNMVSLGRNTTIPEYIRYLVKKEMRIKELLNKGHKIYLEKDGKKTELIFV